MNLKNAIILIFLFVKSIAFSQNEINLMPKQLKKELIELYKEENTKLIELSIDSNEFFNGKFFKIENPNKSSFIYIGRVNACRIGGCLINNKSNDFEYFDYFIIYSNDASIYKIKVYNYQASHGQEICVPSWLKQFVGHNSDKRLIVGKNIDVISGATISVNAITNDVIFQTDLLTKHIVKSK